MSGGHKIFFDAFEMMKQLIDVQEEENKKKALDMQRTGCFKFIHNFNCPCKKNSAAVPRESVVVSKESNVEENKSPVVQKEE